jgi:NADPH:quinone reductase-like Zn-dependent oxidoreductase
MTRIVAPVDFGGPEQLKVSEVPTPQPGSGEVRVVVRAIGVNPIDWKIYSGRMGRDPKALGGIGFELAGVVDAVGEGVDGWSVGDEVIASQVPGNGYTDAAVVPAAGLIAKPEGLSWELAASVPVAGGTAAHAVTAAGVGEGDTVLVHGAAGGVGGLVVQLARRRGARVIATASERNHEYLRSLGAEPVTYGAGLTERVRALAPDGVDAAIDAIGTDEAIDTSLALVDDPSRVVSMAAYQRRGDGIRLIGGGGEPGTEIRDAARPEVAQLLADGELTLPIQATYPLEDTAEAHRVGLDGHTRGKLVIVP